MNNKIISAIIGIALLVTSGGTAWINATQVSALENEQVTETTIEVSDQKSVSESKESSESAVTSPKVTSFSDVKDTHWAKASITAAVEKGYVSGYPGGIFKPDQPIKRDEFIKMVVQALGIETQAGQTNSPWYAPYVEVAEEDNLYLSSDFANNDKAWNTNITRKEMARIAVRAALGEEAKQDTKWMYLATKAGLITGLGKGELGESKTTTRAQSVTIIERILAVKAGEKLPVDKYAVGSAEIAWHGTNIFTVMPEIMVTDESQYKGKTIEELWRQDLMTMTSRDGLYKGALDAVIAIDLEDPNDPNLKLLPPVDELNWFNNSGIVDGVPIDKNPVRKWKESYVLYFKTSEIYNNNKEKYTSNSNGPDYVMYGIGSPDLDKFFSGTLNKNAWLWHKKWRDVPALIIPKTGWIQNKEIEIIIMAPANAGYLYQEATVLELDGPKLKK